MSERIDHKFDYLHPLSVEGVKRCLRSGVRRHSFGDFPEGPEIKNLVPDDEKFDLYFKSSEVGADRPRAVFDNSRLTGKPR